eukprot:Gb_40315 [translate_table: standard]
MLSMRSYWLRCPAPPPRTAGATTSWEVASTAISASGGTNYRSCLRRFPRCRHEPTPTKPQYFPPDPTADPSRDPRTNSIVSVRSIQSVLLGPNPLNSSRVRIRSHNIGVAMATPYGLVVPNIKNVQSLSILEITKELQRLVQGASNNKLTSEDVSGGTITISNFGAIGGKFGSPLLNLPEVAIVAIGRIQKLPRFSDDGTVYPASIMNVTFGADHRVIDGATVAKFCNQWKLLIEKPEHLLLYLR